MVRKRNLIAAKGLAILGLALWAGSPAQAESAPQCRSDRTAYQAGDTVRIRCVGLNADGPVTLKRLNADEAAIALQSSGRGKAFWDIPASATPAPYGLYIAGRYISFIRVLPPGGLASFRIDRAKYRGVDVFTLDGGMSAEYAVAKAGENLVGGVSHSWKVSAPGHGPRPVLATPDFLARSVGETTRFYDDLLGRNAPIDSVILSTGIPSIPYIANSLQAPVLPLHFLVSSDSVREVETVLDTAAQGGMAAYSTLAHDPSVDHAVGWIKLLGLPPAYRDFLKRHRVKSVYVIGSTNTDGGETASRRLLGRGVDAAYAPGSIYIMYPGTSKDDAATLKKLLFDIEQYRQDPNITHVADWESGIIDNQVRGIAEAVRRERLARKLTVISSANLGDLYDLGTYATAALIAKSGAPEPAGFIANPYLIAHPTYELGRGRIPIVYWQGNPSRDIITRATRLARDVRKHFLPALPDAPAIQFNLSRNFGGFWAAELEAEARAQGWLIDAPLGQPGEDELWNPADGMTSVSERIAIELSDGMHPKRDLVPLSAGDLICLQHVLPGLKVSALIGPQPACPKE